MSVIEIIIGLERMAKDTPILREKEILNEAVKLIQRKRIKKDKVFKELD